MKTNIIQSVIRRALLAGTAAMLGTSTLTVLNAPPAWAHEADCPYCQMPVVQDTAAQDNEVKLRFGRKRIEYRCVYCAIAEAKSEYPNGDVAIAAPSEKKGKPVLIKRTGGQWTVSPASAVFVAEKVKHKYCQIGYRALTSRAALSAYKAKNKAIVGNAKPVTLTQIVALAK